MNRFIQNQSHNTHPKFDKYKNYFSIRTRRFAPKFSPAWHISMETYGNIALNS